MGGGGNLGCYTISPLHLLFRFWITISPPRWISLAKLQARYFLQDRIQGECHILDKLLRFTSCVIYIDIPHMRYNTVSSPIWIVACYLFDTKPWYKPALIYHQEGHNGLTFNCYVKIHMFPFETVPIMFSFRTIVINTKCIYKCKNMLINVLSVDD